MKQHIDDFLAYRGATDCVESTIRAYRSILHRALRWLQRRKHRRWATVTPTELDAYLLDLQAHGLRPTSRNSHVWALRQFGAWLLQRGLVLSDPTVDLAVADDDEVPLPPAPLSEEQVAQLFAALPGHTVVHLRNRLIVELLYSSGLRNEETIDLDVTDIDLNDRSVLVKAGKGNRPRKVPMMGGLHAALQYYLAVRRELIRGPDHGALLIGERGGRLHKLMPGRLLTALSREIGFRVHPHLLRHSIAVHLLRRGTDIRMIQEFLGHADLNTTKIYLRLVPGQLRTDYDAAMPSLPIDSEG